MDHALLPRSPFAARAQRASSARPSRMAVDEEIPARGVLELSCCRSGDAPVRADVASPAPERKVPHVPASRLLASDDRRLRDGHSASDGRQRRGAHWALHDRRSQGARLALRDHRPKDAHWTSADVRHQVFPVARHVRAPHVAALRAGRPTAAHVRQPEVQRIAVRAASNAAGEYGGTTCRAARTRADRGSNCPSRSSARK
jgi:hypothetical protein